MHIPKIWYNVFSGVSTLLNVFPSICAETLSHIDNFPLVKTELRNISLALANDDSNRIVDLSRIDVGGYLHRSPLATTDTDVSPLISLCVLRFCKLTASVLVWSDRLQVRSL